MANLGKLTEWTTDMAITEAGKPVKEWLTKGKKGGGRKSSGKKLYRYPLNKAENDMDYLKISVGKYKPPSFGAGDGGGLAKFTETISAAASGGTIPTKKGDTGKSIFGLPQGSDTSGFRADGGRRGLSERLYTVLLPIPAQIKDQNSTSWADSAINPLAAAGVAAVSNIGTGKETPLEAANRLLNTGGGLINDPKMTEIASSAFAAAAVNTLTGNLNINQMVSRASGQVFNPNLEVLFDGVKIREFIFPFQLVARNRREGQEIMMIIRKFKESMAAKRQTGDSKEGLFIAAPDIFQLEYMKGGKKHPFLNSFLPMALTTVQLDYSGAGTYATFRDGTPTNISMILRFKEINPIYAEDYEGTTGVGY